MSLVRRQESLLSLHTLLWRYINILAIVCLLLSIGLWLNFSSPTHSASKNVVAPAHLHEQARHRLDPNILMVQITAQKYMNALLDQRYDLMWSLLHPQMQKKWPGETAFATFWHTRFQDYALQDYSLGKVRQLSSWTDPETMEQYNQVEKIPVSLRLVPNVPTRQLSQLPPENQHPEKLFTSLPFIVQQVFVQGNSNWFVLNGGPADLEAPISPPAKPVNKTVHVTILMYHHIASYPPGISSFDSVWFVSPETFTMQMDYLATHGYHTITFNQLFNALYYGGPLPARPIILTFDDGNDDNYQYAYPILRAHHFSAMFYIVSGRVGIDGHMTWPQLREMLAHGMQMGSHTVHHADLGQLLYVSEERVQQELLQSQDTLQKKLGIVIQHFCYPYGEPFNRGSAAQRQRIMTLLAADSYVGATIAFGELGSIQRSQYPFALLRITVSGVESFQWFITTLSW